MKEYSPDKHHFILSLSAAYYINNKLSKGVSATGEKGIKLNRNLLFLTRKWFRRNESLLKRQLKQQAFWRRNTLTVGVGMSIPLARFLRQLTELGYVKTRVAGWPGEYACRGGVIDIFPINTTAPLRIEFLANRVDRILAYETEPEDDEGYAVARPVRHHFRSGEYVVHLDHGIGVYERTYKEKTTTYHQLRYAGGDSLLVPQTMADKLSPYLGFRRPRVHRLGGALWDRTKIKAKKDILDYARKLLTTYAKRQVGRRPGYPPDGPLQRELEAGFPFPLTADQEQALVDIKKDLENNQPMERLLCGDVGFGKTEVALRAAMKVVSGGRQVFLIAPTTILAYQHFLTFSERFQKLPVNVAMLSRVTSPKDQKRTLAEIEAGRIDILIGTHRLLSKDVPVSRLGMLIIDEEQKFGVRHKETLAALTEGIDVLSLSATPIPRTLFMALAGVRQMNVIKTPPLARQPIKTVVAPFTSKAARSAAGAELARAGQVYWLHNSIDTMANTAARIGALLPRARLGVIHGRLPEKTIIRRLEAFRQGRIDILVATTIIENGLDFPRVNTLIVEDATRLGLAQAHQLRGRVGRSFIPARAFFFYPRRRQLTDEARSRLAAIQHHTALGEGYEIARRDLEIRGSGNILGREQSGTANAIGLNLYFEMLNQAMEKLRRPRPLKGDGRPNAARRPAPNY